MFKKTAIMLLLVLAATTANLANTKLQISAADNATNAQVYELRTYHCNPGKLEVLHARFRDHTNYLFVKHGMKLIGYWTPADGDDAENTLIYIIAHENRDAAKKSWAEFSADPAWQVVAKETNKDGAILTGVDSVYMNPTDYSPIR
jgi:hypothetical protein